jgi:hypothetical protein
VILAIHVYFHPKVRSRYGKGWEGATKDSRIALRLVAVQSLAKVLAHGHRGLPAAKPYLTLKYAESLDWKR